MILDVTTVQRTHRTLMCACGNAVSSAALMCGRCGRVVGERMSNERAPGDPGHVALQDYVSQQRARGLSWREIELALVRESRFRTASEARQFLARLEDQESSQRRALHARVRSLAIQRVFGVVLGMAFLAWFVVIRDGEGSGILFDLAFIALSLVGGGVVWLVHLYQVRLDEERLAELTRKPEKAPFTLEDEVHFQEWKREIQAAKDADLRTL